MATHTLENECLRVTVADDGAELVSVWDKASASERVWNADPDVWNRHAPILFPFVGKVVDGAYRVGNETYPMKTQHGFARDMTFACAEAAPDAVTHVLTDTEWTRTVYPYAFRLTVRHRLDPDQPRRLSVEWTVENTGDDRMFFSIGGHPGFMPPEGVRKEDCAICFPGKDALEYIQVNAAGFALPGQKALALADGRAAYQADIPDTWIFENHQVERVGIATPDGKPYVMLHCGQFPMLAVWANPKGPFICLEPWFGRTDDAGFAGTIDQKKGIQSLEPGTAKAIAYAIDFNAL